MYYVRLKFRPGGPETRVIHGAKFVAGKWHTTEQFVVGGLGKTVDIVAYLRTLRLRDGNSDSPLLFDVCATKEEALAMESRELEEYERAAMARSQPTQSSQVEKAAPAPGMTPLEVSPPAPPVAAPAPAVDVPPAAPMSRRAERLARSKAAGNPPTG